MKRTAKTLFLFFLFFLFLFQIHVENGMSGMPKEALTEEAFAEMLPEMIQATVAMQQATPEQRRAFAKDLGISESEFNKIIEDAAQDLNEIMKQMGTSLEEVAQQMGMSVNNQRQAPQEIQKPVQQQSPVLQDKSLQAKKDLEILAVLLSTLLQKATHPFIGEAMGEVLPTVEILLYNIRTIASSSYHSLIDEDKYKDVRTIINSLINDLNQLVPALPTPEIKAENLYSKYGLKPFSEQKEIKKEYTRLKNKYKSDKEALDKSSLQKDQRAKKIRIINEMEESIEEDFETLLNKKEKEILDKKIKQESQNQFKQNKSMHSAINALIAKIKSYTLEQGINDKLQIFMKEYLPKEYEEGKTRASLEQKRVQEKTQLSSQKTNSPTVTESIARGRNSYDGGEDDYGRGGGEYGGYEAPYGDEPRERGDENSGKEAEKKESSGGGGKKGGGSGKKGGGSGGTGGDKFSGGGGYDRDEKDKDKIETGKKLCSAFIKLCRELKETLSYAMMYSKENGTKTSREARELIEKIQKREQLINKESCSLNTIEEAIELLLESEKLLVHYSEDESVDEDGNIENSASYGGITQAKKALRSIIASLQKKHPGYPCNIFAEKINTLNKAITNLAAAETTKEFDEEKINIIKKAYKLLSKDYEINKKATLYSGTKKRGAFNKKEDDSEDKELEKLTKEKKILNAEIEKLRKTNPELVSIAEMIHESGDEFGKEGEEEKYAEIIKGTLEAASKELKEEVDKSIKDTTEWITEAGEDVVKCSSDQKISKIRESIDKAVESLLKIGDNKYAPYENNIAEIFKNIKKGAIAAVTATEKNKNKEPQKEDYAEESSVEKEKAENQMPQEMSKSNDDDYKDNESQDVSGADEDEDEDLLEDIDNILGEKTESKTHEKSFIDEKKKEREIKNKERESRIEEKKGNENNCFQATETINSLYVLVDDLVELESTLKMISIAEGIEKIRKDNLEKTANERVELIRKYFDEADEATENKDIYKLVRQKINSEKTNKIEKLKKEGATDEGIPSESLYFDSVKDYLSRMKKYLEEVNKNIRTTNQVMSLESYIDNLGNDLKSCDKELFKEELDEIKQKITLLNRFDTKYQDALKKISEILLVNTKKETDLDNFFEPAEKIIIKKAEPKINTEKIAEKKIDSKLIDDFFKPEEERIKKLKEKDDKEKIKKKYIIITENELPSGVTAEDIKKAEAYLKEKK